MRKQQLFQAMLCKFTLNSNYMTKPFDYSSLVFSKEIKLNYLPVKRSENLNYSNMYTLRILSDSELIEGNKDNSNNPQSQLSSSNQTNKIPIHILCKLDSGLNKHKSLSAINPFSKHNIQLINSNSINEQSRLKYLKCENSKSNLFKTVNGFHSQSVTNSNTPKK